MSTDNKKVLIAPSIIAADLSMMGELVRGFDASVVDLLHIDVMDGHFVPNMTFGPGYIKDLKKHTPIPMDVHLMIESPERFIDEYLETKPWSVTIHYESTRFPARLLSHIRKNGSLAGLSINPGTPVDLITDLLPYTDMVLIMSVDPGFYGQSFMEMALGKIQKLSQLTREGKQGLVRIQADGGINRDNISGIVKAGAEIIVAGSSAFKGGDVNANVRDLKGKISG